MRSHNIKESLRPRSAYRGLMDHNYGIAEAFYDAVDSGLDPDTSLIYLPIFWAACYHEQSRKKRDPVFRARPDIQKVIDNLDPSETYFTVMRCDDGPYETLPGNVIVFGCCNRADYYVPLTTGLPFTPHTETRPFLAGFMGQLRCGGPSWSLDGPAPTHSAYNPDGIGTQVRQEMERTFKQYKGCRIEQATNGSPNANQRYKDFMKKCEFALCPRGYAPTSFRLYEAMSFGCVPIYISDRFVLPYGFTPSKASEFMQLVSPKELRYIGPQLAELVNDPWMRQIRDHIARMYDDFFSLQGAVKQIKNMLQGAADDKLRGNSLQRVAEE